MGLMQTLTLTLTGADTRLPQYQNPNPNPMLTLALTPIVPGLGLTRCLMYDVSGLAWLHTGRLTLTLTLSAIANSNPIQPLGHGGA